MTVLLACQSEEEMENSNIETIAVISNLTDFDLSVRLNLESATELLHIPSKEKAIGYSAPSMNGPEIMMLDQYDSIDVIFSNEKLIRFLPDSSQLLSGKNIYDSTDWELKDDTVTFFITKEDFDFAH